MNRARDLLVRSFIGALALTVCVLSGTGTAHAARKPVVLVVGDSLTVGAENRGQLSARLRRAGYEPVIHGVNGMSTYKAPDVIANARRERRIDVIVVALGTNDAMVNMGGAPFGRRIVEVQAAAGRVPVLWVDVHATAFADQVRAANRELARAAKRWPSMQVLAWSKAPGAQMLISDGVHLNARGYQLRATFIAEAVAGMPR